MIRHIVIAALRNMAANRLISVIAILGLAVGIAAALLMAAVIRNQLSFDSFIPGHERTYIAVTRDNPQFTKPAPCPVVPYCQRGMPQLAPQLKLAAPEVEAITRLAYTALFDGDAPLKLQTGNVVGQRWLAGFAYHIALQWWVFAAASLGALVVALATVAGQAFLTARARPVLALRTE